MIKENSHVRILRIRHDRATSKEHGSQESPPGSMWNATAAEVESWRASEAERILVKAKTRQVSAAFSAPQYCEEWIALAIRTTRASRLKVMVRDTKIDKTGAVVLNKKTKRPVMTWRAWQP